MKKLNIVLVVAVILVGGGMAASLANAQSYPDIRGKQPFTQEANYMSLPGFLRWHYLWMSGRWISRAEARLAVQQQTGNKVAQSPRSSSKRSWSKSRSTRSRRYARSRRVQAGRRYARAAKSKRQTRIARTRTRTRSHSYAAATLPQVRIIAMARVVPMAPMPMTPQEPVAASSEPIFLN